MHLHCPLIEISGPPFDRGLSYGRQAAERIALGVAHYLRQLEPSQFGAAQLRQAVAEYLPLIEAFDADFVQEMRGIARGANTAFEEIVLLNARTELLQLARSRAIAAGTQSEDDPDGCTGVMVQPHASAAGQLIHAQNWDWKAECAKTCVVLKVRREHGPDVLTFTEAGALGRSGLNSVGIAITANYLECDRDGMHTGIPLALIRRKVLEQEHLALALRTVYTTRKSASNNMMLSHAEGIAIDFECAPDETFQVHPEQGLMVHANHWLSPVALAKLRETGIQSTPDSLYRDLRVQMLLRPGLARPGPLITVDAVKAALFDSFGAPWSVCRPERPNASSSLSATVAMIVMQPALGLMEVALLPAHQRTFTAYRLEPSFKPMAAASAS